MAEKLIVYQVMNFDREEMFFGTTALGLDAEIVRIAKDLQGPTKTWKKGEVVSWRALTEPLDAVAARTLHREFERGTPPNKFVVLSTYEKG